MYQILKNTDAKVIESNLAPFIVNNFYCNYLSGNYIENNLLYIIAMLLKDEIKELKNINQVDNFLEKTKSGFLLEQLIRMPDIQIYFKNVILKTVEKMERSCSFKTINLNISNKAKEFNKLLDIEKTKLKVKKNFNIDEISKKIMITILEQDINNSKEEKKSNDQNSNTDKEDLKKKYLENISIKEFESLTEAAKNEGKNDLFEYYKDIINNIKSNKYKEELYSNTILMKKLDDSKLSPYLLQLYLNDFYYLISFIKQLIEDLMNNILLLPNSIKYICKIISLLIKRKFNNITKREENEFISKFIIKKLLIPIFSSPSYNAYISDFIISGNTLQNINILNIIIEKLFSGKLFFNNLEEGEYTPFNRFFIEKIENILFFFEKSTNVILPNFIEKYISDELPNDYLYEFFNENKEEMYANISICFTIENLYNLIKGLEKSEDLFKTNLPKSAKLKRSLSKLIDEENFNGIKDIDNKKKIYHINTFKNNNRNKNKEKEIEILNYYLYNDHIIEKNYENLFSINNQIANFYINIKKIEKNTKLEDKERNVIKIKNYLCGSIGNYRLLNKSDFNIGSTSNTIKMLEEIKSYMSLPNFILNNNTIPSTWYINSILEYLDKIPQDYIENDYRKLFSELTQNLNDSINSLDFEKLILFRNKLKFIDKMNNYYDSIKELINNIVFNENIKNIVKDAFIPIDIIFKYDNKEKKFELKQSNLKEKVFEDKIIYEIPKKNITTFKTIEAFAIYFPNLSKLEINPINILRELKIKEKIENYFKIIEEKLRPVISKQYESIYNEKIKDYIMNKIYQKIYPSNPDDKDMKIYNKSLSLSWVDPHLFLNKDYIFDNMLPDILNEFKQINKLKNPFKKLESIKKIMSFIETLIKFNEGIDKEIGAEDITPVLNYIFIKASPYEISTDIEFVKTFLNKNGQFENCLANIESMFDVIINCTAKTFNMTDEEFNKRCKFEQNNINNIDKNNEFTPT